jgi:hypothetical protein
VCEPSYEPTGSASFLPGVVGQLSLACGHHARFDDRAGEVMA